MSEGITCYERDEELCADEMCLRTGCRLRNARLAAQDQKPVALDPLEMLLDAARYAEGNGGKYRNLEWAEAAQAAVAKAKATGGAS